MACQFNAMPEIDHVIIGPARRFVLENGNADGGLIVSLWNDFSGPACTLPLQDPLFLQNTEGGPNGFTVNSQLGGQGRAAGHRPTPAPLDDFCPQVLGDLFGGALKDEVGHPARLSDFGEEARGETGGEGWMIKVGTNRAVGLKQLGG